MNLFRNAMSRKRRLGHKMKLLPPPIDALANEVTAWKSERVVLGHVYRLAIIAIIIALFEFKSFAEEFHAEGTLIIKFVDEHDKVSHQQSLGFEADVKDCKWFIITTPHPLTAKTDITSWEISSDGGGKIYQVARFNKSDLPASSINDSIGIFDQDAVPDNLGGNQVSELWLALASSCYFDGLTNKMIEPIYSQRDPSSRGRNHVVNGEWQRLDAPPHLPQHVVYTDTQIEGIVDKKPYVIPAPHPFENGYTRAEFNVISTTNVGNLLLPKQFSFKEFIVVPLSKASAKHRMFRVVEGYVQTARAVCERTNFITPLTDGTYIDDRRFSKLSNSVLSVSYIATNHVWPPMESPTLQILYKQELLNQENYNRDHPAQVRQDTRGIKKFVVVSLIVASLFPLGLFIRKIRQSGGKT
jgi:hypothetical protein